MRDKSRGRMRVVRFAFAEGHEQAFTYGIGIRVQPRAASGDQTTI